MEEIDPNGLVPDEVQFPGTTDVLALPLGFIVVPFALTYTFKYLLYPTAPSVERKVVVELTLGERADVLKVLVLFKAVL